MVACQSQQAILGTSSYFPTSALYTTLVLCQGLAGGGETLAHLCLWPGMFLSVTSEDKVSIMLSSGAGLEVGKQGPFLSVTILLPEKFLTHTHGLLGTLNDNPKDDFTLRNGQVLPPNASAQQVFQFGANCE